VLLKTAVSTQYFALCSFPLGFACYVRGKCSPLVVGFSIGSLVFSSLYSDIALGVQGRAKNNILAGT
jgi:hypothetical protein